MNKLNKRINYSMILLVLSFLMIPFSYADINGVFQKFYDIVNDTFVIYWLTFILMFIFLYSVFAAGVRKISAFGGGELDKIGKVVCAILSFSSTLGIFTYLIRKGDIATVIRSILLPAGWFAIIAIAILVFSFVFMGIKLKRLSRGFGNFDLGGHPCLAALITGLTIMILGSILEKNSITMTGFIIFVSGLICLIFFADYGRNEGGNRGGGNRGGGGSGGGNRDQIPDFSRQLNEIENLLNQYENEFNSKFKIACNDVLQTHYDYINSLGGYGPPLPPVSATQWQRVLDSSNKLANLKNNIDRLCNEIKNHRKFRNMIPAQRTRFNNLLVSISNAYILFNNYQIDFWNRYNNGDPPA
jgi:hypothetical protein